MKSKMTAFRRWWGPFLIVVPLFSAAPQDPKQQIAAHAGRAQQHLAANRPDLAAGELRAILALDPKDADARTNLGVLLFFQGDFPGAATQLGEAVRLRPAEWKTRALLGMSLKRIGRSGRARVELSKAFPQVREEKLRVQVGLELAEICYQTGDLDAAAAAIAAVRKLKPEDPDILYAAHRIYTSLADESLLSLAMSAPDSARMRQLMAGQAYRQGDSRAAIARYREALRIAPNLPGVHVELAESLRDSPDAADREQSEAEYRAALREDPSNVLAECRLGEIALERSEPETALAHYRRAVELDPQGVEANLGYGRVLLAMGKAGEAEPVLLRAARAEPYNAAARFRLAAAYRELGRKDDAEREFAEYKRLTQMKDRLRNVYHELRLRPEGDRRDALARDETELR